MRPRILVISDYRAYHTARPEAELFVGLAQKGWDVTVMTYPDADYIQRLTAAGCKIIGWHPSIKKDRVEVQTIRDTIIDLDIDIIHAFNSVSSVNAITAAKGLDVKVCLYRGYCGNIHWLDPLSYRKYLHPRVDGIMCNSVGVEQLIRSHLWKHPEKAVTINKGHLLEWYADVESVDIRSDLGINPETLLLVNMANNRSMKGIPYLLKAMTRLKGQNVKLLLVGRDMDTAENIKILEKAGVTDMVKFLGFRTDALSIVKSCDVFVSSSIKGESITKSIIESMCLGVAPIITDIPGNVELVVEGINGLVVPKKNPEALANAIQTLVKDRELLNTFKQNAPIHIDQNLNHHQAVDKLAEWYSRLV